MTPARTEVSGVATGYGGFAGKRLALVESMLHGAFYQGIHDARGYGLEVWLLIRDRDWYGSAAAWVDHPLSRVDQLIEVDTHDARAVAAEVTGADGGALVDGVTTFSDYHTEVAATVAEQLGLPSPGRPAIAVANDKNRLRDALRGRPYTIDHVLVTDPGQLPGAAARLGFPMVAKPPAEAISHGVRLVADEAALRQAYAEVSAIRHSLRGQPRPGHVLLEAYVDAPEVSVESITIDGVTHFYGATAKSLCAPPTFLERAHAFPAALDPDQWAEIRHVVSETLATIGYRQGPAHTELKLTPRGPRIVEVNPRLPAGNITTMVRDVCGRDPHLDAKLLAVGGRVEPPTGPPAGGAAVVVLYPPRCAGTFVALDGVAAAEAIPGVRVVPLAGPGDELWHRVDNSGRVGLVYARAADSGTALATAEAAAARVTVRIDEGH
jgi:biotin carboxylase